jgi:hypothetical protein
MKRIIMMVVGLSLTACNAPTVPGSSSVTSVPTPTATTYVPTTQVQNAAETASLTLADVLAQVKLTSFTVTSAGATDPQGDVVEWAACPSDSFLVGGGCNCNSGYIESAYPANNAYYCRCFSYQTEMKAYANCMKPTGIQKITGTNTNNYDPSSGTAAQQLEADRLTARQL